jgi:hypothetical protein
MVIENLKNVKKYFKDHKLTFPKGINHMRAASELYNVLFLEPAFIIVNERYISENISQLLTMERWRSKDKSIDPRDRVDAFDRVSVRDVIEEIFDDYTQSRVGKKMLEDRVMEYIINITGNKVPFEVTDHGILSGKTSSDPSREPSEVPSRIPSEVPSRIPSEVPSRNPSRASSREPSEWSSEWSSDDPSDELEISFPEIQIHN